MEKLEIKKNEVTKIITLLMRMMATNMVMTVVPFSLHVYGVWNYEKKFQHHNDEAR